MKKPLLICLVLSGFSGLAYELIWVRMLAISFGGTTTSLATVLAVFFAGLGIGSYLATHLLAHIRRPVRAYAVIEAVIGLTALALYPLFLQLSDWFALIDAGPNIQGMFLRFIITSLLLLLPTILMGMTLPLICRAVVASDEEIRTGLNWIYGCNTLGAFLGAYLVTYHLLWHFGVFYTLIIAVGVNFLAAFLANLIAGSVTVPNTYTDSSSVYSNKLVLAIAFLSGFSFICTEVVWVRIFATALQGTVYAVGCVLISVLAGIALGSLFSTWLGRRNHAFTYVALQLILVLSIVFFFRELDWIVSVLVATNGLKSSLDPIFLQLGIVFLTLLVPSTVAGAAFPILIASVTDQAENASKSLGRIYAVNTFGSIVGSLAAGFLLLPNFGPQASILVGLLTVCLGGGLAWLMLDGKEKRDGGILLAVMLGSLLIFRGYDPIELNMRFTQGWGSEGMKVAYYSEGKTSSVVVREEPAGRGLFLNGLGQGGRRNTVPRYDMDAVLTAMIPLSHIEKPQNALVVGLGAGVTVDLLSKSGVHVKVVELEEKVVHAVDLIFENESPVNHDNVDLIIDDARHHLKVQSIRDPGKFDIVTSMPSHPWVAANLFTQEFFELSKANLTERGVFSTWFAVGRNMDTADVRSLVGAFTSVFDHYFIYHIPNVNAMFLVGGKSQLTVSPNYLRELASSAAFAETGIRDWTMIPSLAVGSGTSGTPRLDYADINTDDSLYIELHAPCRKDTGASPITENICSTPFMSPNLFAKGTTKEDVFAFLEVLLGTPNGIFPDMPRNVNLKRTEQTITAAASNLSTSEAAYFGARLAALRGEFQRAQSYFSQVEEDSPLSNRAKKFNAIVEIAPRRKLELLKELSFGRDVAFEIASIDPEAMPEIPAGVLNDRDLLSIYSRTRKGQTLPADAATFKAIYPKIILSKLGILRIASEVASKLKLPEETQKLQTRITGIEEQLRKGYLQRAKQLAEAGQTEAAQSWQQAADELGSNKPKIENP